MDRRTAMEEYGCNCSFDSAGNPVDWCSFHEALRDSLAEKDREIERLKAKLSDISICLPIKKEDRDELLQTGAR